LLVPFLKLSDQDCYSFMSELKVFELNKAYKSDPPQPNPLTPVDVAPVGGTTAPPVGFDPKVVESLNSSVKRIRPRGSNPSHQTLLTSPDDGSTTAVLPVETKSLVASDEADGYIGYNEADEAEEYIDDDVGMLDGDIECEYRSLDYLFH